MYPYQVFGWSGSIQNVTIDSSAVEDAVSTAFLKPFVFYCVVGRHNERNVGIFVQRTYCEHDCRKGVFCLRFDDEVFLRNGNANLFALGNAVEFVVLVGNDSVVCFRSRALPLFSTCFERGSSLRTPQALMNCFGKVFWKVAKGAHQSLRRGLREIFGCSLFVTCDLPRDSIEKRGYSNPSYPIIPRCHHLFSENAFRERYVTLIQPPLVIHWNLFRFIRGSIRFQFTTCS